MHSLLTETTWQGADLRELIGDVKHTIAELAAAEGRLLSIGELFGRAWQLGTMLGSLGEFRILGRPAS